MYSKIPHKFFLQCGLFHYCVISATLDNIECTTIDCVNVNEIASDRDIIYIFMKYIYKISRPGCSNVGQRYPPDKSLSSGGKLLHYPLDRFLSCGQRYPTFEQLGPVNEIHAILLWQTSRSVPQIPYLLLNASNSVYMRS